MAARRAKAKKRAKKVTRSRARGATLGKALNALSEGIINLMQRSNYDEAKVLRGQLSAVLKVTSRMVDANIDRTTVQYNQVTERLSEAQAEVKTALKDLSKVAKAIEAIAKGLDAVGKLAKKVA